MIFPKWIEKGDTIGVTACSAGKTSPVDWIRLDNAAKQMKQRGYTVIETPDVRTEEKGRSAAAKVRAEELMSLIKDEAGISGIFDCNIKSAQFQIIFFQIRNCDFIFDN